MTKKILASWIFAALASNQLAWAESAEISDDAKTLASERYLSQALVVSDANNRATPFVLSSPFQSWHDEASVDTPLVSSGLSFIQNPNPLFGQSPMYFSVNDDAMDGQWLVSFDVSASPQPIAEAQFSVGGAYNVDSGLGNSQFYINYGNRQLPVSISFDDGLTQRPDFYNTFSPEYLAKQKQLSLGFEQQLNESWAVSISYLNSEVDLFAQNPTSSYVGNSAESYQFLFDFNEDGRPQSVNLLSKFPNFNHMNKQFEGIQIKVSRLLSEDFELSGQLDYGRGENEISPFVLSSDNTNPSRETFDTQQLKLLGNYHLNENWSLDSAINHQENQYFTLDGSGQASAMLDSTTLDIGLQYQTQLGKKGLVIRIDLMNLLGVNHAEGLNNAYQQNLDDRGLLPYRFQTPKYLKLSGSINF